MGKDRNSIREFNSDIPGNLAKLAIHVKTDNDSAVTQVKISLILMCSFTPKINCLTPKINCLIFICKT